MQPSGRRTKTLALAGILAVAQLTILAALAPGAAAAAGGVPSSAEWLDEDANGYLDAVRVNYGASLRIVASSIFPDQFTVTCTTAIGPCPQTVQVEPHTVRPGAVTAYLVGATSVDTVQDFTLHFREDIRLTSGTIPDISYDSDAGTLSKVDGAGTPSSPYSIVGVADISTATLLSTSTVCGECDEAPPVFQGATIELDDTLVTFSFSEPVKPDTGLLHSDVFTFDDNCAGSVDGLIANLPSTTADDRLVTPISPDSNGFARAFRFDLNGPVDDQDIAGSACDALILDNPDKFTGKDGLDAILQPGGATIPLQTFKVRSTGGTAYEVDGGQGAQALLVTFNAGATSATGGPIGLGSFQFVRETDADAGAVTGIVDVIHTAGAQHALLVLNARLNAVDMDTDDDGDDGALVQLSASNAIRQVGAGFHPEKTFKVVDTIAPQVLDIRTLDADLDGKLDLLQFTFNECITDPIDNSGFTVFDQAGEEIKLGQVETGKDNAATDCSATAPTTFEICGDIDAPGSIQHDNVLYICLDEVDAFKDVGDTGPLGTGARLRVTYEDSSPDGVISDRNGEPLPTGNQRLGLAEFEDYMAIDGARPLLKQALTRDTDADGKIDGYRLVFSESMRDNLMDPNDWTVAGRSVLELDSLAAPCAVAGVNDECAVMSFNELSTFDTDAKPQVTSKTSPLLVDIAGNVLQPVPATGVGSVAEIDDAAPRLMRVEAKVGEAAITAFFSEPVQRVGSAKGALRPGDFAYSSGNGAVPDQVLKVAHSATSGNAASPALTLNGAVQQGDFVQDFLAPLIGGIQELTTTDSVECGQGNPATAGSKGLCVPTVSRFFSVSGAADVTPPGDINDLQGSATSRTMSLNWTAPGDDGAVGTVAGCTVKVSTTPLTQANFGSTTLPSGVTTELIPATPVAANQLQVAKVRGLAVSTLYYAAVRCQDEVPNESLVSNVAQIRTEAADTENPGAITGLAVINPTSTAVTLSFTAPSEDGTDGDAGELPVDSYVVAHSTTCPITSATLATATTATAITYNPIILAGKGGTQLVTVGGLTQGRAYCFAIQAKDDYGNLGPAAFTPTATTTTGPDITPPGAIGDLATLATPAPTASAIGLKWTAPGDDGAAGLVGGYVIKYSMSPITADNFALAQTATQVEYTPGPPTAALALSGSEQKALVKGLQADTPYYFAVKAHDESAVNLGAISNVPAPLRTAADTTAPVGTLTVTCGDVDLDSRQVTCSWNAVTDPDSAVVYLVHLDQDEDTVLGASHANVSATNFLTIDLRNDGTYYLHVAGKSAGGVTGTAVGNFTVDGLSISDGEAEEANRLLQDSVRVKKDGDNVVVSWIPLDAQDLPGTLNGYHIWCVDGGEATVVEDAPATADEATVQGGCSGGYLVTPHYLDGTGFVADGSDTSKVAGFNQLAAAKVADDAFLSGTMMWIVLGAALLVVVALTVLMVYLIKRRSAAAAETVEGEAPWPGEEGAEGAAPLAEGPAPDEGGIDAAEPAEAQQAIAAAPPPPLPTHNVTCPKCKTPFTAQGQKPLQIECPNCHVKGMLR